MKLRLLLYSGLLAVAASSAVASPLTPSQAIGRAQAAEGRRLASGTDARLAATGTAAGQNAWYAFNTARGYMILSADDVAAPVLAYGDGDFDPAAVPPAMREWLDFYAAEISAASAAGAPAYAPDTRRQALSPVAPLVKARWDQGSPYNADCPTVDGTPTYTGCVATALAQVMRHHAFPAHGSGTLRYIWQGRELSLGLDTATLDWANMDYIYNASSTPQARAAVARLMQACGYAVQSDYGTAATNASVYLWAPALVQNFGYAPSTTTVNRLYYGLRQWEAMIHASLAAGDPVLYSGIGAQLGHAFVCDGYSSDGYFHFNWGWSGLSNGYYLLSALNPSALGIGGGSGGFNSGQIAVVGARPDFAGSKAVSAMGVTETAKVTFSNVSKNFTLTGGFQNLSNRVLSAKVGFEIVGADGTVYHAGTTNSYADYQLQDITQTYARRIQGVTLADGEYSVYPAFAVAEGDSDVWQRMLVPASMPQAWKLTMAGGKGTIDQPAQNTDVAVSGLRATTAAHFNTDFRVGASIANRSALEFATNVYVAFYDASGNLLIRSEPNPVDIPPADTLAFVAMIAANSHIPVGQVTMRLQVQSAEHSGDYIDISEAAPLTVLPYSADRKLKAVAFYVEDADNVDAAQVRLHITAECEQGYYASPIRVWCRPADSSGSWGTRMLTEYLFLEQGQSDSLVYTFQYPAGVPGTRYAVTSNYVTSDGQAWLANCEFTCTANTGNGAVGGLDADVDAPARYYNLQGMPVAEPRKGNLYIVRRGRTVTKQIFK